MANKKITVSPAEKAITAFGSATALAAAIGCDRSTVSCWKIRSDGRIPSRWTKIILRTARQLGLSLTADDLIC